MRRSASVVVLSAAIVVAGGSMAYASIPGGDGTIHGCYRSADPGSGSLYVIDSSATCPSGFTALNWEQAAPAGLQGYEVVETTFTFSGSGGPGTFQRTLNCPTGKVALGFSLHGDTVGAVIATDGLSVDFTMNHPTILVPDVYYSPQSITCATEGS